MTDNALTIGTLIDNTTRPCDVLPALLDALREVDAPEYAGQVVCPPIPAHAMEDDNAEWWDSEDAHALQLDLEETLADYLPPYTYIGAHPDDGADYGVWVDHDAIEMDLHDGELQRIDGPGELDYANTSCAALHINDHGNLTIYAHDGDRWSPVLEVV